MMFEKSEYGEAAAPGGFENELVNRKSIGQRLHDNLPFLAMVIGAVALFFGLHGAGSVVLGAAAVHLVAGVVLVVVARLRTRGAR